jgi:glucokinase
MAKMKDLMLGVDIGGTKIAAGLVTSEGKITYSAQSKMVAKKTAEEGLRAVRNAIDDVRRAASGNASAIGISVPGWVDSAQGVALGATNLPCWRDYPLVRKIEGLYHLPAHLANDANAAALAEAAWGAGAGYRNVFYVTLGTGIGTALVLQHRIYQGRTGVAGEGGHMTINFRGPQCGCGKRGCIETYVSGTAIARRARERLSRTSAKHSNIRGFEETGKAGITAEVVAKAAAAGNVLAGEILDEAADHFAIWLGGIIDLLEPDVIVVGGGVGGLMTSMLPRIQSKLKVWAVNPRQQQIPVVNAFYGSESGLVGAAALCLSRTQVWSAKRGRPDRESGLRRPKLA